MRMRRESGNVQAGCQSGAEVAISSSKAYAFDLAVKDAMQDLIAADRLRTKIAAQDGNCNSCSEFVKEFAGKKLAVIEAKLSSMNSRVVRIAKRNLRCPDGKSLP